MTVKRKRLKPEQIVKLLQEGKAMLIAGNTSGEVIRNWRLPNRQGNAGKTPRTDTLNARNRQA